MIQNLEIQSFNTLCVQQNNRETKKRQDNNIQGLKKRFLSRSTKNRLFIKVKGTKMRF